MQPAPLPALPLAQLQLAASHSQVFTGPDSIPLGTRQYDAGAAALVAFPSGTEFLKCCNKFSLVFFLCSETFSNANSGLVI